MSQLDYGFLMEIASEGLLADCGFKNCLSPRAFADIPIGRGVAKVVGEDMAVRLPAQNESVVTLDADLVTSNEIDISVNGTALATINFNSDHDTTMDDIATALANLDEVATAVVSGTNDRILTITAEQGEVVVVDSFVVTEGASQATATIENETQDSFYGVALRIQNKENLNDRDGTTGSAPYYQGDAVSMLTRGRVYVQVTQAVSSDDPVYMQYVGSEAGRFRMDDNGGEAILVPDARFIFGAGEDELAVLEINMP